MGDRVAVLTATTFNNSFFMQGTLGVLDGGVCPDMESPKQLLQVLICLLRWRDQALQCLPGLEY